MLIGPPAVGKSTYTKKNYPNAFVVSRDDIVDEVARSKGLTYDDLFIYPPENSEPSKTIPGMEKYGPVKQTVSGKVFNTIEDANKQVSHMLNQRYKEAINSERDVVIDMTNMSKAARRLGLQHANDNEFKKIAIVFSVNEENMPTILQRMKNRAEEIKSKGGSKTIGEPVIRKMLERYQPVSRDEGFDEIKTIAFDN